MPEPEMIVDAILPVLPLGLLAALVLFLVVADEKTSLRENLGPIAVFCLLMALVSLSFLV